MTDITQSNAVVNPNGTSTTVVIQDVNVIPMDFERVLEHQSVVIEGDCIAAIAPRDELSVPEDAKVIEGNGAYLMPGLADMHMHIRSITATFEGPDQLLLYLAEGVTTVRNLSAWPEHLVWAQDIKQGKRLGPHLVNGRMVVGLPDSYQSIKITFRAIVSLAPLGMGLLVWLFIWTGFLLTGNQARFVSLQPNILPSLLVLLLVGVLAAGLKIIPLNLYASRYFPFATVIETAAEAQRYVRIIQRAGYDFVKPYDYLSKNVYLAVLDEASKLNFYTVGHLLDDLAPELDTIFRYKLREAAHIDEFTDAHLLGKPSPRSGLNEVSFNYEAIPQTVAAVKNNDAIVVSNLVADEVIYTILEDFPEGLKQPAYEVVPPAVLERWQTQGRFAQWQGQQTWRRDVQMPFLMTLTKAFHEAGVPLLIGTDMTVEGIVPAHIHRELELLVQTGLTPFEALQAGTKNAGESVTRMGGEGNFGGIQVGQSADLILTKNNPLENISHTRERIGVMVRGQWFTQAKLNELVEAYVATYRS